MGTRLGYAHNIAMQHGLTRAISHLRHDKSVAGAQEQAAAREKVPMRSWVYPLLALMAALPAACQPSPPPLTFDGLEPVRLGMTVVQAESALDVAFRPMDRSQSADCWLTGRGDGKDKQISYMVEKGRITRIDVFAPPGGEATVRTAQGIGVGATEAAVLKAYGPTVVVQPHAYEEGHYLRIEERGRVLLFETADGRVTRFRAGLPPAVDYIEGCL
ncbi:hypothetical protein FBZ91_109298 [Nitrospirillum viridazoti]|nr:hypothetical protein FBZ91_109298 [Nitrospirillum amazonense]